MNHQGSIKGRRHSVKRLKGTTLEMDLDFVHKKRTQGGNVILAKGRLNWGKSNELLFSSVGGRYQNHLLMPGNQTPI